MTGPACFLDRDGTLVVDRGYARGAAEIALLPGAGAAVRRLNARRIAAVLVSNQSGVGRRLFTPQDLAAQHERLIELLAAERAYLDGIYFCPHRPDEGCGCRKPGGDLVLTAAGELDLDLARSFAIGDQAADVELGERWLAGGMLVMTGMGEVTLAAAMPGTYAADRVHADVLAAVAHLLATAWAER